MLPPIKEMYLSSVAKLNSSILKKYHGSTSKIETSSKRVPTKRGHYLDDQIRTSYSPGPANASNIQPNWKTNCKVVCRSPRKTYVDQIVALSKKQSLPSPNLYNIGQSSLKVLPKIVSTGDRTTLADHCQYVGTQTPGPGNYNIAKGFLPPSKQIKYIPHKPIKPLEQKCANMLTYHPVQNGTFDKIAKSPKTDGIKKTTNLSKNKIQSNIGPGHYNVLNVWKPKDQLKENQHNFMQSISKGPSKGIYY